MRLHGVPLLDHHPGRDRPQGPGGAVRRAGQRGSHLRRRPDAEPAPFGRASLAFLDIPRAAGDLVRYGDTFNLKNQNGPCPGPACCMMKAVGGGSVIPASLTEICADLGAAAYFPTLGAKPAR